MKERESLGSRLGFLFVSAGCAIGLGNVWRFPYITGEYGGAAFVIMYLLFLVFLALPIMIMEFTVGRASRKDADAVRIITAHSAKGLEYPFVFIPGLEEEIFPHKNAIEADTVEEERRLFYVAMTRARRELTLLWNRKRVLRGKDHTREPSRFLAEIPEKLTENLATPTREEENLEWISKMRARLGTAPASKRRLDPPLF